MPTLYSDETHWHTSTASLDEREVADVLDDGIVLRCQGTLRSPGESYYDCRGDLREPEYSFWDYAGHYRAPSESYTDSKGQLRFPSDSFYDGKVILRRGR